MNLHPCGAAGLRFLHRLSASVMEIRFASRPVVEPKRPEDVER
jgi:hypothetical protein